jgi:hypothetical protein
VDQDGRLIALNFYHPRYGYVTLTTADPFPESEHHNPTAVRTYRARLATLSGYGLVFNETIVRRENLLLEDAIPHTRLTFASGSTALITTFGAQGGALQWWQAKEIMPRWHGRLSLQRCAYTQLTEGGPIAAPPVEMRLRFQEGILILDSPSLKCSVAIAGLESEKILDKAESGAVTIDLTVQTGIPVLAYGIGLTPAEAIQNAQKLLQTNVDVYLGDQLMIWRDRWRNIPVELLVRRGLVYGLSMCIPVNDGICILTDHMILPLSWNRDAYYIARALLSWNPEMAELVRRHLIWMFEVAEHLNFGWGRCYLANGQIKDPAFQLDQQLFPLLELADYYQVTRDIATLDRLRGQIANMMAVLLQRKSAHAMLFSTDETPADDPIALPYHLSSHILLWCTLIKLRTIGLGENHAEMAGAVRRAIDQYFIARHVNGQWLYAYATDGRGRHYFYHDANDLPLALAPLWGFVKADDPVWLSTIDFAFSEANRGGAYRGRLGSVHTAAPWPLGDVQDLIIARTLGDSHREAEVWEHLRGAAQIDGALAEAYNAERSEVVSRHWFAWPNAALACVVLESFRQ